MLSKSNSHGIKRMDDEREGTGIILILVMAIYFFSMGYLAANFVEWLF